MLPRAARVMAAIVAAVSLLPAAPKADARVISLGDLRREVTLADPQISPGGAQVALLVARGDYRLDRELVAVDIVDLHTGARRTLGLRFENIASVRWSPDGRRLAFVASRVDQAAQLFTSDPQGKHLDQLTQGSESVQYFSWRPDGRAIAFVRADPPRSTQAREFEVGDNDYLSGAGPRPSHLWLVTLGPVSVTRRLTQGSWSLPSGTNQLSQPYLDALIVPQHMPNQYFCWYPDGRQIALTRMPDAYMAHSDRAVMEVLDVGVASSLATLTKLTAHAAFEAGCDLSDDGSKLDYWYPSDGNALDPSAIFVTDAQARGPNGIEVTRRLNRSPWTVRWMPDNLSLLVLAHDGTHEGMWQVGLDASVRRLNIGALSASAASVSRDGTIAFLATGPREPTELYVMRSMNDRPRRLTGYNHYFSSLRLGAVGEVRWAQDGFQESGVLTLPPSFVAGRKYPLVLQIHGWPQYSSLQAFDTDYPGLTQLLAAHGYIVFEPNYRGSDGYGAAFEAAIAGDTVAGPAKDILAGIAAVEQLGIVDRTRIGVSGWSYGGLLTAWLIGHDHRWRAAMAGAAPTDLPVDYAISDYNVLDRYFYGAALWASRSAYRVYANQSPISFAWNVNTPTLIMASISDVTVPVTHSYELFHALRDRHVPVQFWAYVSADHFPSDPLSDEDIYRRWVGWFDRYMR